MKKLPIALTALSCAFLLSACGNRASHNTYHHKHINHKIRNHNISKLRPHANYKLSSERAPYPKLNKRDQILVDIKTQRAYIQQPVKNHRFKTIYTMYISSGSHNRTPTGVYHIQQARGKYFYSSSEHEGAQYYVSWKDNGVYLFHATPGNKAKKINRKVADCLGRCPSSHGCIHLSIPDARWFSTNAPVGMKVIIKK